MLRTFAALLVLLMPAAARADWYEASTGHFTVYGDQSPDRLKQFASELERFDRGVRALRNLPDEPVDIANRVTVYMVDDRGDVARLAGSSYVAGFYKPRAGGSMAVVPESSGNGQVTALSPRQILLHEYTHHLMWTMFPNAAYPAWFIEGYAEFHATARFGSDGSVSFGEPPMYRGRTLMAGNILPVEKMLLVDPRTLKREEHEGLYARGWLLTHYLTSEAGKARQGQLAGYILAINSGKSPAEAAKVFGDLRQLDRELERYKMTRLGGVQLSGTRLAIGEVKLRKLSAGEAATMDVRIRSKNGVNAESAPGVYAAAKKAAAPFPDDAGAQIVLAEAAYDAGDFDGAEAAADRALAANPKSVDAFLYKAWSQIRRAMKAGDKRPETWTTIRRYVSQANRLDPNDPKPLILYYRSFLMQGIAPTQMAKDGLVGAFSLAPEDAGLRFNTAAMLLRNGKPVEARTLLVPLAYQPHGNARAERAARLIAAIDAGDNAKALSGLEQENDDDKPKDGKGQ